MANAKNTSLAYTPGPWAVFGIKTDAPIIHTVKEGPAGVTVAIVSKEWGTEEEKEANSCLIAAGPELLEACEKLVEHLSIIGCHRCYDQDVVKVGESAIGKARGK